LIERELIQRARNGEQAAWFVLVENHQQVLFRLAYLILGDPNDAKDVAQEAFIRAHRNLDHFKDQYPLRPWLLRITSNLAYNRLRSFGRYLSAIQRYHKSQINEHQKAPENIAVQKNEAEILWKAVKKLKKIDQHVIYLRFFLDLSVKEAAQVLDVAPGTIKSRQHRALNRLETVIRQSFPTLMEAYFK
jgi:RNA polymerase sigma-70 factor (ECF subfamily)